MGRRTPPPEVSPEVVDQLEHASRVFFAIMVRAMDEIHASVSPAALRALLILDDTGESSLGELARRVPLSQSATSRMVERLVSAGLAERTVGSDDRRQVRITATASGRATTRTLVRKRRAAIRAVAADLDPAALHGLTHGLREFAARAHAHDPFDPSGQGS